MEFFYLLINLTLIISGFVLGFILFAYPIPKNIYFKNYKFSAKILATSYVLLAAINSAVLFFGVSDYQPEFIKYSAIFISSTQSLIFTFTILTLLNPHQGKNILNLFKVHSIIICIFLLIYLVFFFLDTDPVLTTGSDLVLNIFHPMAALRIIFFVFYLYQILIYSLLFHKSIRKFNTSIENYFSETWKIQLNWIKVAFFSALAIGLMAIAFQTTPGLLFDNIFTSIVVIFYILFALNFISYHTVFQIIEPAFEISMLTEAETESEKTLKKSSWVLYKQKVLERKVYLKESITLIEMAQLLNVSRTTLSNFINTEENQNFNSWINQLRISEAKNLMINNPEFSISYISVATGYSEQSNFSREFKQITGETPSAWKKSNISIN